MVNLDVPFETIIDRISVSSINYHSQDFKNVNHKIPCKSQRKTETYPCHRQPMPYGAT